MTEPWTIQSRIHILRHMLDTLENLMAPPEHEENAATVRGRYVLALINAKQVADLALALERDIADGLATPAFLNAIQGRYPVPSKG